MGRASSRHALSGVARKNLASSPIRQVGGSALTGYPLDDSGAFATLFGFSHLATDAPAYNNADFAFTDAGASYGTIALPTQANAFGIQAIPVAVDQIRYFELLFTDIPAVEFTYAGLLAIVVRGGTPIMTPITAIIRNTDGSTPQVGGDQVSYMARTEGAGYRVGIEFNGATDEVTIRSTNGVVGSFTNTALFQGGDKVFFAMIVKDNGTPVMTGETIGMTAIPAAADMWLPVTAGALDVFGTTIAMPTLGKLYNEGDIGDFLYMTRVENLFQDSAATIPVVADGDAIGAVISILGRVIAKQEVSAAKPVFNAAGLSATFEAGSPEKMLRILMADATVDAKLLAGIQTTFAWTSSAARGNYTSPPRLDCILPYSGYFTTHHADFNGGSEGSTGTDWITTSNIGALLHAVDTQIDSATGRFWSLTRVPDVTYGLRPKNITLNGVVYTGPANKYGPNSQNVNYFDLRGNTNFDSDWSIVGYINRELTPVEWAYASLVAHAEVEGV